MKDPNLLQRLIEQILRLRPTILSFITESLSVDDGLAVFKNRVLLFSPINTCVVTGLHDPCVPNHMITTLWVKCHH